MPPQPISIAILDEQRFFCKTLKNYISEKTNVDCIIQASDVFELCDTLNNLHVDLVIMDIHLPKIDGLSAILKVRNQFPKVKILILTMNQDISLICEVLSLGIYGFISKTDEPEDLVQAIQEASENRIFKNKLYTEALYFEKSSRIRTAFAEKEYTLTEREQNLIRLIWEEKNTREIANQLFLSIRSIEKIRQDLKEKLSVKTTIGLLKYGVKRHILD